MIAAEYEGLLARAGIRTESNSGETNTLTRISAATTFKSDREKNGGRATSFG